MALLNYTTTVNVARTLAEVERCLAEHGASRVVKDYAGGEPVAVAFVVPTEFGDRAFRLPARVEELRGSVFVNLDLDAPADAERLVRATLERLRRHFREV